MKKLMALVLLASVCTETGYASSYKGKLLGGLALVAAVADYCTGYGIPGIDTYQLVHEVALPAIQNKWEALLNTDITVKSIVACIGHKQLDTAIEGMSQLVTHVSLEELTFDSSLQVRKIQNIICNLSPAVCVNHYRQCWDDDCKDAEDDLIRAAMYTWLPFIKERVEQLPCILDKGLRLAEYAKIATEVLRNIYMDAAQGDYL